MAQKNIWLSDKGNAITDTWMVAQAFGKRNSNLCKSIRTMLQSHPERTPDYYPTTHMKPDGRMADVFVMTHKGFVLLAQTWRDADCARVHIWMHAFNDVEKGIATGEDRTENANDVKPEQQAVGTPETPEDAPETRTGAIPVDYIPSLPDWFAGFGVMVRDFLAEWNEYKSRVVALESAIAKQEQATPEQVEQKAAPEFITEQDTIGDAISVNELAKMMASRGVDTGEIRLYQWMRDNGYLCSVGKDYNLPTTKSVQQGLMKIEAGTFTKPNGKVEKTRITRVTIKGQIYFVNKFLYAQAQG